MAIMTETSTVAPAALTQLERQLRQVVRGGSDSIRLALVALLADGHLLIEDVPGVGKTTLAHALARSLDCGFQRIQFTSDLLPSDVIGISIFNQARQEFEFHPGPIFTQIVLADEINRTTPKTQSALLEAMSERQVTVDNQSRPLPRPFLVMATQNPVEHHGTYPLPESQLDRFLLRIRMGYPDLDNERAIVRGEAGADLLPGLRPVLNSDEVLSLQRQTRAVCVDEALVDYALELARATRAHPALALGVSPRGSAMLRRAAQAMARLENRDYCVPADFKRLVVPVFAHRLIVQNLYNGSRASQTADQIVAEIRDSTPLPE